ncbi:MAG: PEGA domain-containing protein [Deltaproteobacteria bacterium]|nr:PEGA domain-containing protein [Deltaproteobacteria bacterium]
MAWVLALTALSPSFAAGAAPKSAPTTPTAKTAAQLKAEGDKAFDAFLYEDALRAYEAAWELSPDPALLYNRGRALQALGRHPEALTMLERFAAEAPPDLKAKVPGLSKLIADVRARVATLHVACEPKDAQVVVGDRVYGTCATVSELRLVAGATTVKVEREGHFPFRRDVKLEGGSAVTVEARLLARATSGVLAVVVDPAAARVSVDGKFVGNAPVELVLSAGTHDISTQSPGYEPLASKAVVKADGRIDVRLTMKQTPGLTSRWWFWTSIGAVVTTGVVLTIALTTERDAPSGDFSPGRVGAPLWRFE